MALLNRGGDTPEQPTPESNDVDSFAITMGKEPRKRVKKEKAPKAPKAPSNIKWGRVMIGCTLAVAAGGGTYALATGLAPDTVQIAVVNGPTAANTPLSGTPYTCTEVSANTFPAGTYTCEMVQANLDALFASKDLVAGDWVSDDTFAPNTRIDVSTLDDPSLLAQTFTADAESAVGGRLKPGDLVNILVNTQAGDGVSVSSFLLTKVLLLDVSGEPLTRGQAAGEAGIGTAANQADSVSRIYTVALNPEQTQTLTAAKGQQLTVVLTRPDAPDIKESTVVGQAPAVEEPAPAADGAPATDTPVDETATSTDGPAPEAAADTPTSN